MSGFSVGFFLNDSSIQPDEPNYGVGMLMVVVTASAFLVMAPFMCLLAWRFFYKRLDASAYIQGIPKTKSGAATAKDT